MLKAKRPPVRHMGTDTLQLVDGVEYVVTDPGYVFGEQWDWMCDEFMSQDGNVLKYGRTLILHGSTMYGDGDYRVYNDEGQSIGEFSVDAGMFCVMPLAAAIRIGGSKFSGLAGFARFVSAGGKIRFENNGTTGEVSVVTDGSDDDEEEEDDDDEFGEDDEWDIDDDDLENDEGLN